jgi:hypothetical protein
MLTDEAVSGITQLPNFLIEFPRWPRPSNLFQVDVCRRMLTYADVC